MSHRLCFVALPEQRGPGSAGDVAATLRRSCTTLLVSPLPSSSVLGERLQRPLHKRGWRWEGDLSQQQLSGRRITPKRYPVGTHGI